MQVVVLGAARADEEQESGKKSWAGEWNGCGREVGAGGRCARDRRGSRARPSRAAAATR